VIALDTNILVYAHRPDCPFHAEARDVVRRLATGAEPWGVPLHALVEFLAVVTNTRIWKQPSPLRVAFDQIAAWRESPQLRVLTEDGAWWPTFEEVAVRGQATGAALHDARIVSCCRYNGVTELWTADRDFSRFPAIRIRNPLVPRAG
jgi:toxin-antitoxin system PIN domain toxin